MARAEKSYSLHLSRESRRWVHPWDDFCLCLAQIQVAKVVGWSGLGSFSVFLGVTVVCITCWHLSKDINNGFNQGDFMLHSAVAALNKLICFGEL